MTTSKWITCSPYDRDTGAMMRYILASCQELKEWVLQKRLEGELKPGGDVEAKKKAWLREYRTAHKGSENLPHFTLANALEQVWEHRFASLLEDSKTWEMFSVGPRAGWQKKVSRRHRKVTYAEWVNGATGSGRSEQRITLDRAVSELFDDGYIAFQWGKVAFDPPAISAIKKMRNEVELGNYGDLFRRMESMTFHQTPSKTWRVKWTFGPAVPLTEEEQEQIASYTFN